MVEPPSFFSFARPKEKKQKKKAPPEPIKEDIQPLASDTKLIPTDVSFDSLFSWTPTAPDFSS